MSARSKFSSTTIFGDDNNTANSYKRKINEPTFSSPLYPYKKAVPNSQHRLPQYSPPPPPSETQNVKTRILCRRYALTNNYTKYFEIGACVNNVDPCVELAIGDSRGHEICFTMYTWKQLLQKKEHIPSLLTTNINDVTKIDDILSMQGIIINDTQVIKIFDRSTSIFMIEKTLNKLFDLELCIDHMFSWLLESLSEIVMKFNRFVDIVRGANSKDYRTIITTHDAFEQHCLIDCELAALCLKNIVHKALNN